MRKIILCLFILTGSFLLGQNQEIISNPKVDERVELLSIVFRLAECDEYTSRRFPMYVERIENHFGKYKNHALINYAKNKVRTQGVGYDAVMAMAISITDTYPFSPLVPFSDEIPDTRWGKKKADTFLQLLNQFYADANCAQFFKENHELYTMASERFNIIFDALDVEWYQNFYGEKPTVEFKIIIGLGNGGGNYGPNITVNGKQIVYAIMGTWVMDSAGYPIYEIKDYFPTLVHEFNHSFVNSEVEKFHDAFDVSGKIIYPVVQERMQSQAYGQWEIMYAEAVVRAAVIKYLSDHNYDSAFVALRLTEEINRGFLWTAELTALLEDYDQKRNVYPTLESFMPEIVKFFDLTAKDINTIANEVDRRRPKVVTIYPFANGSRDVSAEIRQIEVVFDKALTGNGYSINNGENSKKAFPEISEVIYSENKLSAFINLELKPNTEYQFVLTGWYFKSEDGYGIDDYTIQFKTNKK